MEEKSFKLTEENAVNSPVQNIEWEGQTVETEGTPLMNDDTGRKIILRVFDFDLPPLKEEDIPTKEDILAFQKTKITGFLWRDELILVQDMRVVFSKDKKHYRIFAPCQAKLGSNILEKAETLQHIMHGST